MLKYLLPRGEYGQTHPFFIAESARLGWPHTIPELKRYGRLVLIGILAPAIGWWLIERVHINFGSVDSYASVWQYNLPNLIFVASLACTLLTSSAAVVWAVEIAQRSLQAGQPAPWSPAEACDAIARIRAWRLSIVEVALRLATSALLICDMFYGYSVNRFWELTVGDPFGWLMMAVMLTIIAGYGLEPLYRVRAITALTVAATLRLRNDIASLLAGFIAVALIHLLQVGAVMAVWQAVLSPTESSSPYAEDNGAAIAIVLVVGSLIVLGVFHLLYRVLRRAALSYAARLTPVPTPPGG